MKTLIPILAAFALAACSMHDTVDYDQPTAQVNDLTDPDTDGVINARDKCDSTILGADIDNDGCGRKAQNVQRFDLKVLFANDSDYIDPRYYSEIGKVAEFMKQYPETELTLEGHCSKTGGAAYNVALSKRRVDAVAKVLEKEFSIAPGRVTTVGYGFSKPLDTSMTEEAHRKNRRVVAELSGAQNLPVMKWTIYTVDQ
ncbi:OmpA family protein [Gallaecimonas mangrovi]|uniref:OmpA family protein n=1 Tax=Gallaecimonas mangrovi TaxID=2291597 RepID=UPI000E2042E4|nr:OmpA family protein [Gallaecimonas mangrovi]